jgi:hypothetical protein
LKSCSDSVTLHAVIFQKIELSRIIIVYLGFEGPTAVVMKNSACYPLHPGSLLDLFFEPEDGSETFLRNTV